MRPQSFLILLLFALSVFGCTRESINCGVICDTSTEELLFQTGFNSTTLTNGAYQNVEIEGIDPDYPENADWATFRDHPRIGYAEISYEDGDDTQRQASLVADPDDAENSVLKFEIKEPHIQEGFSKKGRVQLAVHDNQCISEVYQTVRLQLDADLAYFTEREDRLYWFTLFEFWNNAAWTRERNPFRVSVNLNKEEGIGSPIHFRVKSDYQECRTCDWQEVWGETDIDFPLVFGEWMDIELYLKEGDANTGRFYLAVTPENGEKIVLFDIYNTTQHPEETCADGYTHFEPMKLYLGEDDIRYMQAADRTLAVYWDDWQFYVHKTL